MNQILLSQNFSPLEFDEAWEIALAEISYPVYIKNFDKEDLVIYEWPARETIGPDYQKAFESKNVSFMVLKSRPANTPQHNSLVTSSEENSQNRRNKMRFCPCLNIRQAAG